jgi:uncharacterized protein YneF (UPF0154 family)
MKNSILYIALCLLLPIVWGTAVYFISARIEKRVLGKGKSRKDDDPETLPIEWHI